MAELNDTVLNEIGLEPQRIHQHQQRICAALSNKIQTTIPVLGGCTTQNGGVVSWNTMSEWTTLTAIRDGWDFSLDAHRFWTQKHVVTVVPAAGAASRFLSDLQRFRAELETMNPTLAQLSDAFWQGNYEQRLSAPDRETLLLSLRTISLPKEIAELPLQISEQHFSAVKAPWQGLSLFLCSLVSDGEPSEDFAQYISAHRKTQTNQAPRSPDTLLQARLFSHWETDTSQDANTAEDQLQATQPAGRGSFLSELDWVSRIFSASAQYALMADKPALTAGIEKQVLCAYAGAVTLLRCFGGLPKALVPTTAEGDSFLRLKLVEQLSLFPCSNNALIVPAKQQARFQEIIQKEGMALQTLYNNIFELEGSPFAPKWLEDGRSKGGWSILEQGESLSTIRFQMDGSPFVEADGKYSLVAAGHGELVHLFEDVTRANPEADCLHIRNVDNIIGTTTPRQNEMATLAETFRLVRDSLEALRADVDTLLTSKPATSDFTLKTKSSYEVIQFLSGLLPTELAQAALRQCRSEHDQFESVSAGAVYAILGNLFHWPSVEKNVSPAELWMRTQTALARPLSVFGVVRKESGDQGGGPVFVRFNDGTTAKICMEMPHASPEDSREYFGTKGKATHFNPVLVFFEVRTHTRQRNGEPAPGKKVDFRRLFDDRFWLLSKKEYQGKPVCYHETVLYELIGNSATTNLIFVEVPRTLFNPHKTIFESLGRDRNSYGFDETLGQKIEENDNAWEPR